MKDINNEMSDALGARLLEIVQGEEFTPGWGQVVLRYLKDNGGALPQPGELMNDLRDSLPFKVAE